MYAIRSYYATVLDWVNRGITGKIDMDHYATLAIVALNVATGELEYANAAHQPLRNNFV